MYACALLSTHTDKHNTKGGKGTICLMSDQANETPIQVRFYPHYIAFGLVGLVKIQPCFIQKYKKWVWPIICLSNCKLSLSLILSRSILARHTELRENSRNTMKSVKSKPSFLECVKNGVYLVYTRSVTLMKAHIPVHWVSTSTALHPSLNHCVLVHSDWYYIYPGKYIFSANSRNDTCDPFLKIWWIK